MRSGVKPTNFGKWVVITGATDGIGKALGFQFAKAGMSVVLISRTASKLDAVAAEIKEKYPDAEVKTLAIDYSNFDQAAIGKVKALLESIKGELGILVNNVGMSYSFPQFFHELSDEDVDNLMTLNVRSTTVMTRLVLPAMVENKKGAVLNIGSFAGLFPNPLLAEYCASKAYVEKLSSSLATEYAGKGIVFQCHVPLYVVSKLSKFKRASFNIPSADTYAAKVVKSLGNGQQVVSAHLPHRLITAFIAYVPASFYQSKLLGMHLGIRKKGLAKLAREQESKKDQ